MDPASPTKQIRFAASLPHGLGKQVRVAVFADGDLAKAAKDAGADEVGLDDLATSMKKGNLDYNVVIAAKMAIPKIAALGKTNLRAGCLTQSLGLLRMMLRLQ